MTMDERELKDLMGVLKMMEDLELSMAELYQTCAQMGFQDREFWAGMEQAEVKHAKHLDKMKNIVMEKPERFTLGRPFKTAAIRTSIAGIQSYIQRLRKKEISEKKMLHICRDIEQAVLEASYAEVIKTEEPEFRSLMNGMTSDTSFHREGLMKKIKTMAD